MDIGLKIKQLIDEKNISVIKAATEIGISRQYLHDIFSKKVVRTDIVEKIANYFNVPISYFFDDENQSEPPAYKFLSPDKSIFRESFEVYKRTKAKEIMDEKERQTFLSLMDAMQSEMSLLYKIVEMQEKEIKRLKKACGEA